MAAIGVLSVNPALAAGDGAAPSSAGVSLEEMASSAPWAPYGARLVRTASGTTVIEWRATGEDTLREYRVREHCGDSVILLGRLPDDVASGLFAFPVEPESAECEYQVTAVDVRGRESPPATVRAAGTD